jgi:hypothetical protein
MVGPPLRQTRTGTLKVRFPVYASDGRIRLKRKPLRLFEPLVLSAIELYKVEFAFLSYPAFL